MDRSSRYSYHRVIYSFIDPGLRITYEKLTMEFPHTMYLADAGGPQFDGHDDSPTPTPWNTVAHTPMPSAPGSPRLSPDSHSSSIQSDLPQPTWTKLEDLRKQEGTAQPSPYRQLLVYFALNLSLTLLNKALLEKVSVLSIALCCLRPVYDFTGMSHLVQELYAHPANL